jgi:hypothetical protein
MTSKLLFVLALQFVMLAQPTKAADIDSAGRAKLAELMALMRQAPDECERSPGDFSVLALYAAAGKNAPDETQIEKKEDELIALRKKVGLEQFCAYFVSQMRAAKIIAGQNNLW